MAEGRDAYHRLETPVSPSKTSREGPRNRPGPDAGSFLVHRELLFSIVYNMLGTVTDTEDVVQETWLSWAAILGRSSAAVRRLAHRAKERVEARGPRYDPDRGTQRIVTERFLDAALGGDLDALMDVLAPEVVMWSDGGGKRRAALRVVEGREKVARLVAAVSARLPTFAMRPVQLNGGPGVVVFVGGTLCAVAALDPAPGGDRVRGIEGLVNPDKPAKLAEAVRPG